jgi:AcrR family transcriptional regulator
MPTSNPLPGNRAQRRKEELREKIADAAYELFVRDGIANTSIAAIVRHADIAHQTFFNHFPTKDHLLLCLADRLGDLGHVIFEETARLAISPPDKIDYCYRRLAEEAIRLPPNMKELLAIVLIGQPGATNAIREEQDIRLDQAIRRILEEAEQQEAAGAGIFHRFSGRDGEGIFRLHLHQLGAAGELSVGGADGGGDPFHPP